MASAFPRTVSWTGVAARRWQAWGGRGISGTVGPGDLRPGPQIRQASRAGQASTIVTLVSVAVAAAPGAERANRFIVILLGLQRLSYLLPALLTLGGAYHIGGLNTALVLLTI